MALLDRIDGSFLNFTNGWAFAQPVRNVNYNLALPGLSVAVAFVVGTVEILGLVANEFRLAGFWSAFAGFNINTARFVIAGLFVVWFTALVIWRFGHVEERSGPEAQHASGGELALGRAYREPD
jgi:high-affinity nickel-transport protein